MKKSRNNSTKKILVIILALILGSFIGYRFALAQSGNALKSVVEPGSMTSEASYIIFTDGSTAYARNGTTGEIDFSGTDAAIVMNLAINSLTNGGKVLIKSGVYNLSSRLYVGKGNLIIEGESWSTVLKAANNTNLSQVVVVDSQSNVTVSDIMIDGNSANNPTGGAGLQFYNSPYCYADKVKVINSHETAIAVGDDDHVIDCLIDNSDVHGIWVGKRTEVRDNVVKNTGGYGIICSDYSQIIGNYIEGGKGIGNDYCGIRPMDNATGVIITGNTVNNRGDDGIDIINQTDCIATDNNCYNNTYTGIIVYGGKNVVVQDNVCRGNGFGNGITATSWAPTNLTGPDQVIIEGNIVYDNDQNGILVKDSKNIIVKGNMVFDNSQNPVQTSQGIYVSASDSVLVEGNRVFDDQVNKTQKYGIWLAENQTNITVVNNDIRGNMYAFGYLGGQQTVRSNIGYVTENSGNATVSNNDWIAHGLATTPTIVTLTPRSNATIWINNRNATHFQVGVSSGTVTVDWHAEV